MEKGGQVTLFILVAVLIVSAVLVFFLWAKPTYISRKGGNFGFENCVKDALGPMVGELGENAGFISPEFAYQYDGKKFAYLCYTNEYYSLCTIQKPFLRTHFQEQMEKAMKEKINNCYENSVDDLKARGYSVVSGSPDYKILLEPGVVRVEVNAPTVAGTQKFARFNIKLNSPIYEMLMIATSILQYETKYGDSDVDTIMIKYPDYIVNKLKRGDGTTIYTIKDKLSGIKFQFASRSLAWPAGYDLE